LAFTLISSVSCTFNSTSFVSTVYLLPDEITTAIIIIIIKITAPISANKGHFPIGFLSFSSF